jgi:UPF0755 protein
MRRSVLFLAILIVLGLGFFIWWKNGEQAVDPSSKSSKLFVVEQGTSIRGLGNSLKKEGLIRDPVIFFLYVKKNNLDKKIQAGDFRLSSNMSLAKLVDQLQHGSLDIWVTVPEGKRADEIADILAEKMPGYSDEWRIQLRSHEGFLFPDTYLLPRDASIDMIVSIMQNTFFKKVNDIGLTADSANLNRVVTVASLLERETRHDEEKPVVASIIYNRLDQGMPLQIDATVQYALGTSKDWWKKDLTYDDLKINSPYNTYKNTELPPGPIANPGITSLTAALNPAKSDYLYYLHDKNGTIHYAKTGAEHNANIAKYLQ